MTYPIYKQGVPSATGTAVKGSLNANSTLTAVPSYQNINGANGIPSRTGSAVGKGTIYKAGVPSITGIKQAGSLNANGVLTVAPGRNTPQS